MDAIDRTLIGLLRSRGRVTNSALAAETGLARGTVQTRLARLVQVGVIEGWGPDIAGRSTDYSVTAFITLSIAQGAHDHVVAALDATDEVLEVHVVTGQGDLLCRVATTSNDTLHELIQDIVGIPGVLRTETQLALASPIRRSLADLIGTP